MITQTLKLNLIPGQVLPRVNVSQYDAGTRTLQMLLYNGDQVFNIASGMSAFVQGTKPDRTGFQYSATSTEGSNVVTADITQQMTAVSGEVTCELVLASGTDRIATVNFIIYVEPAALADDTVISETELPLIEQAAELAQEIEQIAADVEANAEKAEAYGAGTIDGDPVPSTDPAYHNNAKYYSEQAAASAAAVADEVEDAEAWAVGERGGVPVTSGDDTYHNNSKYYAGEASDDATAASASASAADTSALKAEGFAVGEQNGTAVTSGSPYYHNNAEYYAGEASTSATNASNSETNAGLSESAAAQSEEDSEAWAVGERNGVPVTSGDPTYQNNAKYYAQQAGGTALSSLVDVAISSASNGQVLAYNSTASKWENESLGTAAAKDSTNAVTSGSTDLVESGAVYSEIQSLDNSKAAKTQITNPNLLDNPWFTVNQRGQSSYTGLGYTYDRWYHSNADCVTAKSNGVITLSHSSASWSVLIQRVEDDVISSLRGKDLTLSIMMANGEIKSITKQFPSSNPSQSVDYYYLQISNDALLLFRYDSGGFWDVRVALMPTANTSVSFKAVKLELGSVSTLALDVAPDYVTELAKCRASKADPSDTFANQGDIIQAKVFGELGAKNLLPNEATSQTINGVTFTVNDDGSVLVNGTYSSYMYFRIATLYLDAGDYILSGVNGLNLALGVYDDENDTWIKLVAGEDASFYLDARKQIDVDIILDSYATGGTNLLVKPMIRLASIADDTYVPYAMTNREMTPYVQAISNPNLLDNPWFTVNQRGQTTYSGAVYGVDRWKSYEANNVQTVNSEGILVTRQIAQVIDEDVISKILDRDVTISMLYNNGKILKATGKIHSDASSIVDIGAEEAGIVNIIIYDYVFGNNQHSYSFQVNVIGNDAVQVEAVKFELGSVSTLAMDTAPNYATELLKCQRYFFKTFSYDNSGIKETAYVAMPHSTNECMGFRLPVEMRATPTITIKNVNPSISDATPSWVSPQGWTSFWSANGSFTVGTPYIFDFEASADL